MKYEETFNEKIDMFKEHSKYPWLRKEADTALSNRSGFGLKVIISDDFMDRIIAMPKEYIQDWLDEKNHLEWRRQDKLMLDALKGNYVELHTMYPDVEIHKIRPGDLSFYQSLGFTLLSEKNGNCFVGKLESYDFSKVSTEELAKMEQSAYAEYYRLSTQPSTNPSKKDLQPLEDATAFWEAISEELKTRKRSLDAQIHNASFRVAENSSACKTHDQILGASHKEDVLVSEALVYDRETAQHYEGLVKQGLVDVVSPQEAANLFGKPVKDGSTIYHPVSHANDFGR